MNSKSILTFLIFNFVALNLFGQCVTDPSATLAFISSSGTNCTFNFTPSAIINNTPNVKMVQFTLPAGSTPTSVCYSGNPIASVPCTGGYDAINNNASLVTLPTVSIVMPCSASTVNMRAQTATNGTGGECSPTTGQSPSIPLTGANPIKISFFNGISQSNKIALNWQTESEIGFSHFVVQRSGNALEFGDLETIKADGESTEKINYRFIDNNPFPGINYYRLRQVDKDGTITFSKIIEINSDGGSSEILVYPNPGSENFRIRSNEKPLSVEVFDISGKPIKVGLKKESDAYALDFSRKLESGIYLVKISTSKGVTKHRFAVY